MKQPISHKPSADCCSHDKTNQQQACHPATASFDYLLFGSLISVVALYIAALVFSKPMADLTWLTTLSHSVYELINAMWLGLVMGIVMLSILARIPREFVMSILGTNSGLLGILRATAAGVLLDLCSHGILMVGSKLYERGASIGQVSAFLIASPWNSFSLTFILFSLIGFYWTLLFILFSMLIAVITGYVFDRLVAQGRLPANSAKQRLPRDFQFCAAARQGLQHLPLNPTYWLDTLVMGIKESRMVMRWILFGVLLASILRVVLSPEYFSSYFGPTMLGLGMTLLFATVIEICSEGSTPIAADILTRAGAPGNSFAFLMAGVATDYTEIMVLKETTRSWKIALLLPIITVPQVIFLAWLMNG